MVEVFAIVAGVFVAFATGTAVGAHNATNIDNAIAHLKQVEQGAQATLAKIAAHKAS